MKKYLEDYKIKNCPDCGHELELDATCPNCGKNLEVFIGELKIQTPLGEIIAKPHNAYGDYPGISLQTGDNSPAVYLEYDELEKCFLITIYVCGGELTDDPVHVIKLQ